MFHTEINYLLWLSTIPSFEVRLVPTILPSLGPAVDARISLDAVEFGDEVPSGWSIETELSAEVSFRDELELLPTTAVFRNKAAETALRQSYLPFPVRPFSLFHSAISLAWSLPLRPNLSP